MVRNGCEILYTWANGFNEVRRFQLILGGGRIWGVGEREGGEGVINC